MKREGEHPDDIKDGDDQEHPSIPPTCEGMADLPADDEEVK